MKSIVALLFILPTLVFAQQPSHYLLGEDELEGVDIYGIHHAADQNYYLATSTGLIVYDGYDFVQVQCDELTTGSVFNLVEDYSGNIYCNNLSGQVFKLNTEGCEFFFAVPDSAASADIGLEVDNLNRLVVRASGLMFLNGLGEIEDYVDLGYSGYPIRMTDSSLWVFSEIESQFISFKNGDANDESEAIDTEITGWIYNVLEFGGKRYQYELNTCRLFDYDNSQSKALINPQEISIQSQSNRIYKTSNSVWLAPNSAGVYQFNEDLELVNEVAYFPKTLISTVKEDSEGNILMGTFGNGIIVIPNEQTLDFTLPDKEEKIISIECSQDGTLYFGTLSGRIYTKKDAEISLFREGASKRVESLFLSKYHRLIIGDFTGTLINTATGFEQKLEVGSMKDVVFADANRALIGSNVGVFWVDLNTGACKKIEQLPYRHFCVGFSPKTGSVYGGGSKGMTILNHQGNVKFVELNGQTVRARDFDTDGKLDYVATADNGVLVFDSDTVQNQWNISTGLISTRLYRLQVKAGKVVISTDAGVQILDSEGRSLYVIQGADGLASDKVSDFELFKNELWVVHGKGVQKINLNELNRTSFTPILEIQKLTVNDTINVSLSHSQFDSDQQKLTFELSVHNLRYQKEIKYEYKLEGADKRWQTARYGDHIINYQSLASGDYTFRTKAVCRDAESEEITYSFTIATPFYMAWWFYTLITIGVVFLLLAWFKTRLKRQTHLAQQRNELNASKLTAIQSQMNPHFIFNALNSIQDLVLKGDVTNSYTYITKFADLVRRTLNYSDKDFIDFENELKLIELYLTLEKLRFNTNFEFSIDADGVEDIQIPPMLIQPFIENALVHGLLHLEGEKKLDLRFELKENLICTITDNGVGREKAKEIKERQRVNHESFSVNAIKRRFEILKRSFGGNLGFSTEDLEENGKATGTRVRLVIPVKRKF